MPKNKQSHTSSAKGGPHKGDWHVAHTSMGMGDYYGTGIKAKVGKAVGGYSPNYLPVTKSKLGKPPKSLA